MRVPYAQSVHGQPEIDAVVSVLNGNTALGPKAREFERRIATLFGKQYGVMVNSGSSANLLALTIAGLQPDDEVVTPLLTFGTVVAPMVQKGLVPVFVDVEEDTYLADLDQVEAAIGRKTRALMIPSLLGNVPDLERLRELAVRHGLWLIEDSCDTLGATFRGRPTGAYSHISTTSFYGSHIINAAGGGGMVMVQDRDLANRLVVLRGWGRQSSLYGETASSELIENRFTVELDGVPYDNKFVFSEAGYNFLPLEIQAAFGLVQLGRLPDFAAARRYGFASLSRFFERYEHWFALPRQTPGSDTAWLAFPVVIRDNAPFTRKELAIFLEERGIQTRPVFTGNALRQPAFRDIRHRLAVNDFPNTDQVMRGGLVFACHQGLTEGQRAFVRRTVREFLERYD